jgi:uncharacterized membrane protein YdfJ with MMPL/SSD domain
VRSSRSKEREPSSPLGRDQPWRESSLRAENWAWRRLGALLILTSLIVCIAIIVGALLLAELLL